LALMALYVSKRRKEAIQSINQSINAVTQTQLTITNN